MVVPTATQNPLLQLLIRYCSNLWGPTFVGAFRNRMDHER
jgi:hypothetical protein